MTASQLGLPSTALPETMTAFVVSGPGQGAWQTVDVPSAQLTEAIVAVAAVGLCGTDAHIFSGESPNVRLGLTPCPWRPGHEWAGTVVAIGSGNSGGLAVGDRVVGDRRSDDDIDQHHQDAAHIWVTATGELPSECVKAT